MPRAGHCCFARKKARRSVPAHREEHAIACRGQHRRHVDKAVNVVRPAVQQNDSGAIRRTGFGVGHGQEPGVDLLLAGPRIDWGKRRLAACAFAEASTPSWATAAVAAARLSRYRRGRSIFSEIVCIMVLPGIASHRLDQPNVNAKASMPGAKNSISNSRSTMG
jgi:hypothetical protein